MQYYQVNVNDADDDSEDENLSHDDKGVKGGHYEGSHSPFGMIYQIVRDAGWPVEYVLQQPYARLMMMLHDAPRYISKDEEEPIRIRTKEQFREIFGGGKTPNK